MPYQMWINGEYPAGSSGKVKEKPMSIHRLKLALPCALLLLLLTLAACNSNASTSSPPVTPIPKSSPVSDRGTQLLAQAGQMLNGARTLHAIADISIVGPGLNGSIKSEIWNLAPDKNRTVVLQSNIGQFGSGTITVSDGKQIWQYNPQQKVVYNAQISASATATPTTGNAASDQSQMIFNLVRSVFTHSNATLVSSSATINGQAAYDIAITSQAQSRGSAINNITYSGDVFLDKTTSLPLRVTIHVQGLGQITLDLPMLTLNQQLDQGLFTFTPPPGVKVQPFPTDTSATGTLTLAQAQQQAGYHLLSIPGSATTYKLLSVDALGAPGNQIYSLNYQTRSGIKFTIAQSKALANLPVSGQHISLRGTTATVSTAGSAPSISWTEKGIGIQIVGPLSASQLTAIANLLS
jgi:outer membrane lipoprotein-sorting protein